MAEEEEGRDSTGAADASAGLGESDIEQNVYEGGFKSWEGATDLSLLLSDQFAEEESAGAPERRHVIEVCLFVMLRSFNRESSDGNG